MITEDEVAQAASREQEYDELASSIGLPNPPGWSGARLAAGLALVSGAARLLLTWWLWDLFYRIEGPVMGAPDLTSWFVLMVATVAALVTWLALFRRDWERQTKEQLRERTLVSIVATEPDFLSYYTDTVGELAHFGAIDANGNGGHEELARKIGRLHPASWRDVWVVAGCVWLGEVLGWALGFLIGIWGLVSWALALLSLAVWLGMWWWLERREQEEAWRRWWLVNAVARKPSFLAFYEAWCRNTQRTGNRQG